MWSRLVILLVTVAALPAHAQEMPGARPEGDGSPEVEAAPAEVEPPAGEPEQAEPEEEEPEEEEVWPEVVGAPSPEALIELAATREAAGDGGLAVEALERFLETFPFDPRVGEVTARLAALRKAETRLVVESPHVSASVWMNGSKIAGRTPAELDLPAGRHRIVVTARDGRSKVFEIVLPPASKRTLEVTFPGDFDPIERARFGAGESLVVAAKEDEEPSPLSVSEARKARRRVVALAGASSAALVLTGVFGMMALSDAEEFRREPSEDVARSGERAAILADVSLGVAFATGLAALVLEVRERKREKQSGVSLQPSIGPSGAGLVLRGGM